MAMLKDLTKIPLIVDIMHRKKYKMNFLKPSSIMLKKKKILPFKDYVFSD